MRFIGLDVHRDFCEVAISEGSAGRVDTSPQALQLFAGSLASDDRVVLESTSNARAIARILEPHVAKNRDRQPNASPRDLPRQGQKRPL